MNNNGFNSAYIGQRKDIEQLVPVSAKTILDVGCSVGTLGESLKKRNQATVFGVELSDEMAEEARTRLDTVLTGDASEMLKSPELADHKFDCIIFADILEHLQDPWTTLQSASHLLARDGCIVTSIPNIRHMDSIWNLVVRGRWPYRNRGIHDRTHLRFFTLTNIKELFETAGMQIEAVDPNYRILERPHNINRYARFFALPVLKNFLAFQYVIRARPTNT